MVIPKGPSNPAPQDTCDHRLYFLVLFPEMGQTLHDLIKNLGNSSLFCIIFTYQLWSSVRPFPVPVLASRSCCLYIKLELNDHHIWKIKMYFGCLFGLCPKSLSPVPLRHILHGRGHGAVRAPTRCATGPAAAGVQFMMVMKMCCITGVHNFKHVS